MARWYVNSRDEGKAPADQDEVIAVENDQEELEDTEEDEVEPTVVSNYEEYEKDESN